MTIARPGQRRTTSPQRGDGSDIPSTLPNNLVGEVMSSYKSEDAERQAQDALAAAELVAEELRVREQRRYKAEELLKTIAEILNDASIEIEPRHVLGCLATEEVVKRVGDKRRSDTVYTLQDEAQSASPPNQADVLAAAIAAAEGWKKKFEEVNANTVSPEVLEHVVTALEGEKEQNAQLRAKLEKTNRELASKNRELEETQQECARLKQQLADAKALPHGMAERLRNIGVDIGM